MTEPITREEMAGVLQELALLSKDNHNMPLAVVLIVTALAVADGKEYELMRAVSTASGIHDDVMGQLRLALGMDVNGLDVAGEN